MGRAGGASATTRSGVAPLVPRSGPVAPKRHGRDRGACGHGPCIAESRRVKLTLRLLAALVAAVVVVTIVATMVRNEQLREALLDDTRDDYVLFARGLRAVVADAWNGAGETEARRILGRADAVDPDHELRIGIVELPIAPPSGATSFGVPRGEEEVWIENGHLVVIEPLGVPGSPRAALRVERPLSSLDEIVAHNVWQSIVSTFVVILACALSMSLLGWFFVGLPVQRLIGETRRIGAGELGRPVALTPADELGELARELAAMSRRLGEGARREADAHAARIGALEQLRHADRLRTVGQLASGLAHELGTPLNVVSGRARLIEDADGATDEIKDDARIVLEQTVRITSLVRQLLGFARRNAPRAQEVDLAGIASRVARLLGPMAIERGVEIELAAPAGPCLSRCDALLVEQALTNVVLNGIQATVGPGRVSIHVGRQVARLPRRPEPVACAVLTVVDDGPGVPDELVARIFDPFFTTKDVGEGTGLGLSVVFGILEDHGGKIEVGREPGRGARFDLFVPLTGSMIPPAAEPERPIPTRKEQTT